MFGRRPGDSGNKKSRTAEGARPPQATRSDSNAQREKPAGIAPFAPALEDRSSAFWQTHCSGQCSRDTWRSHSLEALRELQGVEQLAFHSVLIISIENAAVAPAIRALLRKCLQGKEEFAVSFRRERSLLAIDSACVQRNTIQQSRRALLGCEFESQRERMREPYAFSTPVQIVFHQQISCPTRPCTSACAPSAGLPCSRRPSGTAACSLRHRSPAQIPASADRSRCARAAPRVASSRTPTAPSR